MTTTAISERPAQHEAPAGRHRRPGVPDAKEPEAKEPEVPAVAEADPEAWVWQ
jgi:hypothetical protein